MFYASRSFVVNSVAAAALLCASTISAPAQSSDSNLDKLGAFKKTGVTEIPTVPQTGRKAERAQGRNRAPHGREGCHADQDLPVAGARVQAFEEDCPVERAHRIRRTHVDETDALCAVEALQPGDFAPAERTRAVEPHGDDLLGHVAATRGPRGRTSQTCADGKPSVERDAIQRQVGLVGASDGHQPHATEPREGEGSAVPMRHERRERQPQSLPCR